MQILLNEKYKRLEIVFDYNPRLVDAVRTLPDRRYHDLKSKRFWSTPATPYHAKVAVDLLSPLGFKSSKEVKSLATEADMLTSAAEKVTGRNYKNLYPFQAAGVDFLLKAGGRGFICDDPGLGKTVQALTYLRVAGKKEAGRVLVVAPASVIYKWEDEIEEWLGWEANVVNKKEPHLSPTSIQIISYDRASRAYLQLKDWGPTTVILDEFHYLKSYDTQRSKAARFYTLGSLQMVGLSGSPFPNRPMELFNPLNMMDAQAWPNFFSYAIRFGGATKGPFGWEFKGATNQKELADRLKTIMIRRTKQEVFPQLPPLTRVNLPVPIPMKRYREAIREGTALQRLTSARVAVGLEKSDAAVSWAQNFLESTDEKLVIFCRHLDVLSKLEKGLSKYTQTLISGETPAEERRRRNVAFQDRPSPRIMFITTAGGEGINLYRASNVLFVERLWSPLAEEQIEGRLRPQTPLQPNPVTAWYLVAQGTVDEKLANFVNQKRVWFHEIVGGDKIETIVKNYLMEAL